MPSSPYSLAAGADADMNIRCVTFDLDDTLWDVAPVIARAEHMFYDWVGEYCPRIAWRYTRADLTAHRSEFMASRPDMRHDLTALRRLWLAQLIEEFGYRSELAEPGFQVFWRARNEVEVFVDAMAVLERIGATYRIGAITNGNADVDHIGIGHLFDFVVTAARAGAPKPHPDIFRAALQAAGVPPHAAVHVGDDPQRDVAGASEVGMRTVWVNATGEPWAGVHVPDAIIPRVAELEPVLERWNGAPG